MIISEKAEIQLRDTDVIVLEFTTGNNENNVKDPPHILNNLDNSHTATQCWVNDKRAIRTRTILIY